MYVGRTIYISGGTGYLGASLIPRLCKQGHFVRALCRAGSEQRLHRYADAVIGDALDASTFSPAGFDTFIHLVGTPHPAPWKRARFRAVDLVSVKASVTAAVREGVSHFIYVSVAHPAPVMKDYIEVRRECEQVIANAGLRSTIVRPWYVLGPGHRWPVVLKPAYWLFERLPVTRVSARRLGLVTRHEMVTTVAWAVDNPPHDIEIVGVEDMHRISSAAPANEIRSASALT
jgi:uncharacterized protein YbjT (DUF2867 family)